MPVVNCISWCIPILLSNWKIDNYHVKETGDIKCYIYRHQIRCFSDIQSGWWMPICNSSLGLRVNYWESLARGKYSFRPWIQHYSCKLAFLKWFLLMIVCHESGKLVCKKEGMAKNCTFPFCTKNHFTIDLSISITIFIDLVRPSSRK